MEVDEIQPQACKFPRTANGTGRRSGSCEVLRMMGSSGLQCPKGKEGCMRLKGSRCCDTAGVGVGEGGCVGGWHHHSRIVRVSRVSGGKDRHSKVLTSKGLRDRRVRLSVPTAIQFYDIQDRLGYNQPSKAVEWLIKAAADSIFELPSLNESFAGGSSAEQQSSDEKMAGEENGAEKRGFDWDIDVEESNLDPNSHSCQRNRNLALVKSARSSASGTSKGSSRLSLSRSELQNNRVRAPCKRAQEMTSVENKVGGCDQQPLNLISQSSSFIELLTGGFSKSNPMNAMNTSDGPSESSNQESGNCATQWSLASTDNITGGLPSIPLLRNSSRFADRLHMLNNQILPPALPITPFTISSGNDVGNHNHAQYYFVHEGFIPAAATTSSAGEEYNQNFMISSGSAASVSLEGFNRGTLQSNSSSQQQFLYRVV